MIWIDYFVVEESLIVEFQRDSGFTSLNSAVDRKFMKAILNTDGYRLSGTRGRTVVRIAQQFLNREY